MSLKRLIIGILCLTLAATAWAEPMAQAEQQLLLDHARRVMRARLAQEPPPAAPDMAAASQQRACFVTFFVKGKVMACFGSFTPRHSRLSDEIADNIRLALIHDPRSAQLTPALAQEAQIQITFPKPPRPVPDWRLINPHHEGLLLERGDGHGVAIVPGEARTAHYAWRSALRRLGLHEQSTGVRLYRFQAEWIRSGQQKGD